MRPEVRLQAGMPEGAPDSGENRMRPANTAGRNGFDPVRALKTVFCGNAETDDPAAEG